jgi:hypothetical protein
MIYRVSRKFGLVVSLFAFLNIGITGVRAGEQRHMKGWGLEDAYNKHYDVAKGIIGELSNPEQQECGFQIMFLLELP